MLYVLFHTMPTWYDKQHTRPIWMVTFHSLLFSVRHFLRWTHAAHWLSDGKRNNNMPQISPCTGKEGLWRAVHLQWDTYNNTSIYNIILEQKTFKNKWEKMKIKAKRNGWRGFNSRPLKVATKQFGPAGCFFLNKKRVALHTAYALVTHGTCTRGTRCTARSAPILGW